MSAAFPLESKQIRAHSIQLNGSTIGFTFLLGSAGLFDGGISQLEVERSDDISEADGIDLSDALEVVDAEVKLGF